MPPDTLLSLPKNQVKRQEVISGEFHPESCSSRDAMLAEAEDSWMHSCRRDAEKPGPLAEPCFQRWYSSADVRSQAQPLSSLGMAWGGSGGQLERQSEVQGQGPRGGLVGKRSQVPST